MTGAPITADFGITISCFRGDLWMLKACLNSLRRFDPATPICLIKHRRFDTDALCALYGATAVEQTEVDPRLVEHSYGYGLTKMIAFWHAPFERFLHVDADTIAWGDVAAGLPWRDFDFIHNQPHEAITPSIVRSQYFDPDILGRHFPEFECRDWPLFNAGVFMARRGLLSLDAYLELLAFKRDHPGSFFHEQGILNFMIFRAAAAGELGVGAWPFQAIVPVLKPGEAAQRFRIDGDGPAVSPDDRRFIHWAGPKPWLTRPMGFDAPMTWFRSRHLERSRSPWRAFGRLALIAEEWRERLVAPQGRTFISAVRGKLRTARKAARRRLELA